MILVAALSCGLVSSMAFSAEPVADGDESARTREAMRAIFSELRTLLPATIHGDLDDPARAAELGSAFRRMAQRAQALSEHGSPLPAGSRLFAGVLARDVRRAEAFFSRGNHDSASFFVTAIVQDCTACHTRQKSLDAAVSKGFVSSEALAQLDPLERAALAVATRRFDEGLGLYEAAFAEPDVSPGVLLGPLSNYLTTAIRVTREPSRAAKSIAQLAARPGLPEAVKGDLDAWLIALRKTKKEDLVGTTVDDARTLLRRAESARRYPADLRPLVDYLVASAKLHDLSTKAHDSPELAAEVFELLGRAELGIEQNMWQSRADLYWETAIRTAPGSPPAKRAFERLETEVRAGFTGSSGTRLPADEAARIEELRGLLAIDPPTAEDGKALFAQHCALCHGADARGNGLFAKDLMWIPADLTRIAARRKGKFPQEEVFGLIARRDPLGSHRSPEMPRWGEFWADDSKIDSLVAYLRKIQRP